MWAGAGTARAWTSRRRMQKWRRGQVGFLTSGTYFLCVSAGSCPNPGVNQLHVACVLDICTLFLVILPKTAPYSTSFPQQLYCSIFKICLYFHQVCVCVCWRVLCTYECRCAWSPDMEFSGAGVQVVVSITVQAVKKWTQVICESSVIANY